MPRAITLAIAGMTMLAAACGSDSRTVVTVYSPHGKELLSHYERAFEAANSDVDIRWVELGSQEILDRLRQERQQPAADVWFGAPRELFIRAAEDSLLDTIAPTWAGALPEGSKDAGGRWYGTYLTPEVIGYNSQFVPDSEAPTEWKAVGEAKWNGKVIMRDPVASGTMRAIFGAIMQQSVMETGKTDSGWALLRRLDANTAEYATSPDMMYDRLVKGGAWITLYDMPDMAALARRTGAPVRYRVPVSGTPVLVDAIALLRGSAHREAAMRFIEWVTSVDALVFAADSLLRIPARTDIPDARLPEWVVNARSGIKTLPVDQALMADSLDIWMRAWDSAVRGRNGSAR